MQAIAPAQTLVGGFVQETSVAITWAALSGMSQRLVVDLG